MEKFLEDSWEGGRGRSAPENNTRLQDAFAQWRQPTSVQQRPVEDDNIKRLLDLLDDIERFLNSINIGEIQEIEKSASATSLPNLPGIMENMAAD